MSPAIFLEWRVPHYLFGPLLWSPNVVATSSSFSQQLLEPVAPPLGSPLTLLVPELLTACRTEPTALASTEQPLYLGSWQALELSVTCPAPSLVSETSRVLRFLMPSFCCPSVSLYPCSLYLPQWQSHKVRPRDLDWCAEKSCADYFLSI